VRPVDPLRSRTAVPQRPTGTLATVRVLYVCTANLCRSPMAAALFAREVDGGGESVETSSAGILPGGAPVPTEVREVMSTYGIDLSSHRSRTLTEALVADADLLVGMGRRHVREAVLLDSGSWPRAFTFKSLVQKGREVGPRPPGSDLAPWLDALHEGRTRTELAGRSSVDEVADPYGGPFAGYRDAARELSRLTFDLAELLWPGRPVEVDTAGE
jgi:protein-tyrosine phosphatase